MSEGKFIVKSKDVTDPNHGCAPEERSIEVYLSRGVVNLDKPSGPTSHEVDHWVKEIFGISKVGHGGTLDPKVTGILPILLGDATKAARVFSSAPKEYVCLMKVHADLPPNVINDICYQFVGKIYQRPPLKSAVKRRIRIREIYYLNVLEIKRKDVLMIVGCEAGTYIRKLISDIGEVLGCGAHMAQLRRTLSGPFREDETLVTLQDLKDAYHFLKEDGDESFLRSAVLPMEMGLSHLPKIFIRDSAVDAICHGASLMVPGVSILDEAINARDLVAVFTLKGEAVSIGTAKMNSKEMMGARKGIAVATERVFMKEGTYPKRWRSPQTSST
ncbi:MAG: RNA-guided pseudouridylation complex pseudouridine synthase subunit Cbf5 [Halobacteriota archaeon]|nr:RNA-guided pseudouridylation complex pseudouridine synthase subunit Cbf5 [Halobacteriota archaeon]